MVQVLEGVPSFGQAFARGLGSGAGMGLSQASQFAQQMLAENTQLARKKNFIESFGKTAPNRPSSGTSAEFADQMTQPQSMWQQKMQQAKAAEIVGEHGIASILMEEAKHERDIEEAPRKEFIKSEYKALPKFRESIAETEDRLPVAEASLEMMKSAIESGQDPNGIRQRMADLTGIEGFRTSSGAELQSAVKQYFLGDLSSIKGGRPNMLIERQLLDAYPKMGRSMVANQKMLSGMEMSESIAKEKVRVAREIEEEDLNKYGYIRPGFEQKVRKTLKPIVEKIEKDAIKRLSDLDKFEKQYEKSAIKQLQKGEMLMMAPDGSYKAVPKQQYPEAKEAGYIRIH